MSITRDAGFNENIKPAKDLVDPLEELKENQILEKQNEKTIRKTPKIARTYDNRSYHIW